MSEHVHRHEWRRPLGKLKDHLILCPKDPALAYRHTACGQTVFLGSAILAPQGDRCKACERTNLGRDSVRDSVTHLTEGDDNAPV